MTQAVLFDPGREGFANAEIAWGTAAIKCVLGRGYTFSAASKFVSDLAGHTAVATSSAFASKTYTSGVCDAADFTFSGVGAGAACPYLIIYQASAVTGGADVATSAQRLIAYIDNATGLPVTPNGGDVTITFDAGTNKIFKL
jgi:hypothetical protein